MAAEAVRQVIADTYGHIQVGFVYTCHTFGQVLVFKPHVHLVMTKGGMKDGVWVDIDGVRTRWQIGRHLALFAV